MKTSSSTDTQAGAANPHAPPGAADLPIVAATAGAGAQLDDAHALDRAQAFARPLLETRLLDSGEEAWSHAQGVAQILKALGAGPGMQAAAYLVYAGDYLQRPKETVAQAFGESYGGLVELTRKLVQVQRAAREASVEAHSRALQTERVRMMLLEF
jgi:GTP pyrophosphokinase